MEPKKQTKIFTIGYSTKSIEEFTTILKTFKINFVLDIRSIPKSRYNPQFNKENLSTFLKNQNIKYLSIPQLGGYHHSKTNSPNAALKNKTLRGYADYMQTKEFTEHLLKIIAFAQENQTALMCSEAIPTRCHRTLISDALTIRNIDITHILSSTHQFKHELNQNIHIEGTKITYPLYISQKPQKKITDFWKIN